MKAKIDALLAGDEQLQTFLTWRREKTISVEFTYKPAAVRAFYLSCSLDLALDRASDPELKQALHILKEQPPDLETLRQWWQANGNAWTEDLRAVMIKHRNIGHDWQFSAEQMDKLSQYYEATQLLVDCLNSDGYVTRSVWEKIEATLLLPIST